MPQRIPPRLRIHRQPVRSAADVDAGQQLNVDQQSLDFAGASAMLIVILVIGLGVDTVFAKIDLTVRRRRGLLDPAAS